MKKIVAALDSLKFSASTSQYAIQLAIQNNAHLVGVFLDDFTNTSYSVSDLIYDKGGLTGPSQKQRDSKDDKTRAASAANFEKACRKAGIDYSIHHDRSIAIQELLHESIYADLIIIDGHETLTHFKEKIPTEFIQDLLSQTQCPVVVVPHLHTPVNKLVLLYDGAPPSVHAIKMFSYILPSLKQYPAEIVSVRSVKQPRSLPENDLMKEFMKRHFPKAVYTVLKGPAETQIVNYLKKQKGAPLVVLGAYQRSTVSRWFRQSMADVLMKELKLPLFIAHNK